MNLYTLKRIWCPTAILVENIKEKYLKLQLDLAASTNSVPLRGSAITHDSIPPKSR